MRRALMASWRNETILPRCASWEIARPDFVLWRGRTPASHQIL